MGMCCVKRQMSWLADKMVVIKLQPAKLMVFICFLNSIVHSFDLMILHASDINSEFEETPDEIGGFPRLYQYVKEKRIQAENGVGPPVIVLMTGNFFGASIWYSINRWRIVSDFINLMKPDAIALGTREFNDGLDELYHFLNSLKCPILGTNMKVSEKLLLKNLIQKTTVLHVHGKKIVVLGYTHRSYLTTKSVHFGNIIQSMKDECNLIKSRGDVDYVIAIGHATFQIDKKIALNSDCVRVVIGSNSKMFMYTGQPPSFEKPKSPYPFMITLSDDSKIPIVHSYINGKYLGELVLTFNDDKELVKATGNLVLLNKDIQQDKTALALLERYTDNLERKKKHIVGKTLISLDGNSCNMSECTLGNIITDSFCDYKATQNFGLYWTNVAVAMINSGAIKATQNISKQGKLVNEAFLYKSLPYQEQLVTVQVSGKTLFEILKRSVTKKGTPAFLQVSGLRILYNKTVHPPLMEVMVRCAHCEVPAYETLNETDIYDIVTTKYLVEGGDGYSMLEKRKITYHTEIINSLQATMRYMKDYKKIFGQKEERITIDEPKNSAVEKRSVVHFIFILFIMIFLK